MQDIKKGVADGSQIYFHTPSGLEKSMFLYPICIGHFFCTSKYVTSRVGFDNYLFLYVKKGKGTLIYADKTTILKEGDLVYIDCNRPHTYHANEDWETLWMHFDGMGAKEFYMVIKEKTGNVIEIGEGVVYQILMRIFKSYQEEKTMNEAMMSSYIQRILTDLYQKACGQIRETGILLDILQYIEMNYKNPISLNELADMAHLSPYYFCRMFKKEMGYTPYEYIIILRLNVAKSLLKKTNKTVKEVAYETGFHSEANFIRTFKTYTNMTPGKFKKTEF